MVFNPYHTFTHRQLVSNLLYRKIIDDWTFLVKQVKMSDRVATSLGEKNSRTFQGHSSMFSRPISATFYCDAGILKVIA